MPLSDQEIKELIEKAEAYETSSGLPKLEQALKCYNKIIASTPPHPHYYFKRAKVKYSLVFESAFHDLDSAIEDVDRTIELEPDKGEYYRLRGEYLMLKLTEGRYVSNSNDRQHLLENIERDFSFCKKRNPIDPQLWLDLIEAALLSHDYDKAIGFYGDCGQFMVTKENKLVRSFLGCLALALAGDFIEEEDTKPFQQVFTYDEKVMIDERALQFRFLRINEFLIAFRKGVVNKERVKKVQEVQRLFSKTTMKILMFNYEKAPKYNKSIQLKFVDDMELVHIILLGDKSYEMAKLAQDIIRDNKEEINNDDTLINILGSYDKTLRQKPYDTGTWYNKGVLLNYFKQNEKAITAYEIVASHGNSTLSAAAWHNKGIILETFGRYEEASEAYANAITSSSDDIYFLAVAWFNKGNTLSELNRHQEALEAYDRSIELNPNFTDVWYRKAEELDRFLHNFDEAFHAYDKSINTRPYYTIFRSFFLEACSNKFELCDNLSRYQESLGTCEKFYGRCGDQFEEAVRFREGNFLEKLERHEEALEAYDIAIERCPNWDLERKKTGLLCKGDILKKLGRHEEARQAFEKAESLKAEG